MGRKTNSKRSRLVALFAVILAAVGALVLMPKPAMAEDTTCTLTVKKVTSAGDTAEYTLRGQLPTHIEGDNIQVKKGDTSGDLTQGIGLKNDETFTISGMINSAERTLTISEAKTSGISTYVTAEGTTVQTDKGSDSVVATITVPVNATTATVTFYNMTPEVTTKVSPSSITPKSETDKADITDEVSITGLTPGSKYMVEGALVDKSSTDKPIAEVTKEVTAGEDGTVKDTLTYAGVKVGELANKTLVAFAKVKEVDQNDYIATHEETGDTNQTVTINEIPKVGNLSITKTLKTPTTDSHIENPKGETDEEKAADKKKWETRKEKAQNQLGENKAVFLFKVDLKDADGKTLEDEFKYTGASEGTFKSGDSIGIPVTKLDEDTTIIIEGLPEGTTYTVTETTAEGYVLKDKQSDTGKIDKGETSTANFTNAPLGSLKIIKNIKITAFDAELELYNKAIEEAQKEMDATTDQSLRDAYQIVIDEANKYKEEIEKKKAELAATEFTFTVTLTDADKKALTETKEYKTVTTNGETGTEGTIKFEDGKSATVKLKGGEYITVIGMDPEYNVSVAETPADGWTANHKSLSGTVIEGVPLTATFENTYSGTDTPTYVPSSNSSGSTTTSSTKLANTADPVVDAVLIAAAGTPVALSGLALRRRK